MPNPWAEMAEARRRGRLGAILDATAALVTEHGLHAVTMSRIAERAGISRTALARFFSDVDEVMRAWHHRQVADHLAYLDDIGDQPGDPVRRLEAVLRAYAVIAYQTHGHHHSALGASLHDDERLGHARRHLHETIRNLLAEGAKTGHIRDDVAPDELAGCCVHALSAAGSQPSATAIRQLVNVTLAGLRQPLLGQDHGAGRHAGPPRR